MSIFDLVLSAVTSEAEFYCPHCNYPHEVYPEYSQELMTVHADGDEVKVECQGCAKTFYVVEMLTRKFDVSKNGFDK